MVSAMAMATGFSARAQSAHEQRHHGWVLRCDAQVRWQHGCYIYQSVALQQTGQKILDVVAGILAKDGRGILHFTLPLGLYLPAGIALKIDQNAQTIVVVETCGARGCEAALPLDPALLRALQNARALQVGFLDAASRRQITVTVSLYGFKAAFAALAEK